MQVFFILIDRWLYCSCSSYYTYSMVPSACFPSAAVNKCRPVILTLSTEYCRSARRKACCHGSRLGYETNGLSRSTLQRALLVILLTSTRGIKHFTERNALGGVNCNYLHEWIFGLPLNLKQFLINLIFIPPHIRL